MLYNLYPGVMFVLLLAGASLSVIDAATTKCIPLEQNMTDFLGAYRPIGGWAPMTKNHHAAWDTLGSVSCFAEFRRADKLAGATYTLKRLAAKCTVTGKGGIQLDRSPNFQVCEDLVATNKYDGSPYKCTFVHWETYDTKTPINSWTEIGPDPVYLNMLRPDMNNCFREYRDNNAGSEYNGNVYRFATRCETKDGKVTPVTVRGQLCMVMAPVQP